MKIADYLRLQRDFDRFALSMWRAGNVSCLKLCANFLVRVPGHEFGAGEETPVTVVERSMYALHIKRRPDIATEWAHMGVGTWLFAAYPELFDKIAETGDARLIDLGSLKYVTNPSLPQKSGRPSRKAVRLDELRYKTTMGMTSCSSTGRNAQIRKL